MSTVECVFFQEIFRREEIKFFEEVNDREGETSFEKKGVLAIDSLVTACTCFTCIYINIYIYIRDVSIHVRVGVDIYIMLTRT